MSLSQANFSTHIPGNAKDRLRCSTSEVMVPRSSATMGSGPSEPVNEWNSASPGPGTHSP